MLYAAGSVWWEERLASISAGRASGMWRIAWALVTASAVLACAIALPVAPVESAWWKFSIGVSEDLREEIGWIGEGFAAHYLVAILDSRLVLEKHSFSDDNHGVLVPHLPEDVPFGGRKQKANPAFVTTGPFCSVLPCLDGNRHRLRIVFQLVQWPRVVNAHVHYITSCKTGFSEKWPAGARMRR